MLPIDNKKTLIHLPPPSHLEINLFMLTHGSLYLSLSDLPFPILPLVHHPIPLAKKAAIFVIFIRVRVSFLHLCPICNCTITISFIVYLFCIGSRRTHLRVSFNLCGVANNLKPTKVVSLRDRVLTWFWGVF